MSDNLEVTSRRIQTKNGEPGMAWVIDRTRDRVWATVGSHRVTFSPESGGPPYSEAAWLPLDQVVFLDEG